MRMLFESATGRLGPHRVLKSKAILDSTVAIISNPGPLSLVWTAYFQLV